MARTELKIERIIYNDETMPYEVTCLREGEVCILPVNPRDLVPGWANVNLKLPRGYYPSIVVAHFE